MSNRTILMAVYVSAPGEHVHAHAMPQAGSGKIELATVRGKVTGSSFLDLASVSPEVAIVELRQFANLIEALLKKDSPPKMEKLSKPVAVLASRDRGETIAMAPEAEIPIPFTQKVKAFLEKRYGLSIGFLVILGLSLFSDVLNEAAVGLRALADSHRASGAYHLMLSLAIFFLLFVLMGEARTNKETIQ